jgi:hypothetical protein
VKGGTAPSSEVAVQVSLDYSGEHGIRIRLLKDADKYGLLIALYGCLCTTGLYHGNEILIHTQQV